MTSGATKADAGYAGVLQTLREMPTTVRFVLLGVFINQFGAFLQFFLVLYLTQRGFSNGHAGFALGAYSAGAIFGTLFGGALSDRLGSRWTIILSVGSAALFTLSITTLDAFPAIVVAVALSGAMTQAARPAVSALLFSMVPASRQVMVFAMYRTALNSGVVAGPLVAVWLSTFSWDLVFYFDAVTALIYGAIAAFVLPKDKKKRADAGDKGDGDGKAERKAGYLTLLLDRKYLAYLALMLANGLVHVQFFAVLPLMLAAAGYATWAYGSLTAMAAFVVISCELLVTKSTQKWPAWIAVLSGWVLLVIGRALFGLPGGLTIIFIGSLLAVIGQIIGGPAAFAYPAKVAKEGVTGRYIGSAHAMFGLGYAIGPLLGIMLWTGIGNAFWG
ncbi:MAG: MFS transporter, partial [Gammaproteobacteria bacterium]